jgi:hypothetical protein
MILKALTRTAATLALSFSTLALVSCAGGPSYAETKSTLPPIAKGKGRVFVYRASSFGLAIKPTVNIDGKAENTLYAQGFFYSDQTPGSHKISIKTEANHENTVSVKAGQPSFVQCKTYPGFLAPHFIPNQVDNATGEEEIRDCKLAE